MPLYGNQCSLSYCSGKTKYWLQGLDLVNASVKTDSIISIFPSGDYKMIFYGFTGNGELIGAINAVGAVISSNRDTFG